VRSLLVSIVVVMTAAGAADASGRADPAFLGANMADQPYPLAGRPVAPRLACVVQPVADSPAAAAGVASGDIVLAIDGVAITHGCNQLAAAIVSHQPGDDITLAIDRANHQLTLHATLLTRAEALARRFVGRALGSVPVTDVEQARDFDLADLRGETRVLVWLTAGGCAGCEALVGHLEAALAKRAGGLAPHMLGVTFGDIGELAKSRVAAHLGIPVAVADPTFFEKAAFRERDRAYIMVVDCKGVVRFVSPIVPEGDDVDAAIDDIVAAVDQSDHARFRR
jgi:hypothetical protein